jgi:hypothetical protein
LNVSKITFIIHFIFCFCFLFYNPPFISFSTILQHSDTLANSRNYPTTSETTRKPKNVSTYFQKYCISPSLHSIFSLHSPFHHYTAHYNFHNTYFNYHNAHNNYHITHSNCHNWHTSHHKLHLITHQTNKKRTRYNGTNLNYQIKHFHCHNTH